MGFHSTSQTNRRGFWQALQEFLFGMVGLEFAGHALEMRASLESLFMLATVGEMIGVPILPPYYSMRLLPYLIPNIATWKRRVLRQKEFTDEHDYHLEGL
ncbi:MAG: hypothetical protein A2Z49_04530 [Chloroflexi bacterium RBG_19FT_COMBO_56_12]|nr:MAG: hypothetical protein A2Z49_04530 [Chloroflexi bacterium RBG_19FT_COMBO_56_12]